MGKKYINLSTKKILFLKLNFKSINFGRFNKYYIIYFDHSDYPIHNEWTYYLVYRNLLSKTKRIIITIIVLQKLLIKFLDDTIYFYK